MFFCVLAIVPATDIASSVSVDLTADSAQATIYFQVLNVH